MIKNEMIDNDNYLDYDPDCEYCSYLRPCAEHMLGGNAGNICLIRELKEIKKESVKSEITKHAGSDIASIIMEYLVLDFY